MRRGDRVFVSNELLRLIDHSDGSEVEGVALRESVSIGPGLKERHTVLCSFQASGGYELLQEIPIGQVYRESETEAARRVLGEDYV